MLSEFKDDLIHFAQFFLCLDHVFTGGSLRASVCVLLSDALVANNNKATQANRRETETETCGRNQTWLASYKSAWSISLSPFGAVLARSRPSQVCKRHSL